MAKILAIETSTDACSAALDIDGQVLERYEYAPQRHAELILPMVDALLKEAGIKLPDLDALAFGRGPGAFTGVRIATGVVQGLAFGAEKPVVPVSSLAALAQGASERGRLIMSAFDARMGEIYWGLFRVADDDLVVPVNEEQVQKPGEIQIPGVEPVYGVGTGWRTYGNVLSIHLGDRVSGFDGERYPHAREVLKLAARDLRDGKAVAAEEALPVYIRNKVTG